MALRGDRFQYSAGFAAGMEFEDSGDEFMFGDDGCDSESEMFESKVPTAKPKEIIEVTPQRRAPWANSARIDSKSPQKLTQALCSTERCNGHVDKPLLLKLEDEEIRAAINNGDIDYITDAIDSGFDVNAKLKSGWTCLMYAATATHHNIVKLLLEKGASVNFQKDMFTPLMALCFVTTKSESQATCARALIDAGARINAHDRHLMTPLMYAAQSDQRDVLQLLIQENADINAQDSRGWTALAFAANAGHVSCAKILLQNNALGSLCAYDGQSPADLAYSNDFPALADIIENPKVDSLNDQETLSCQRRDIKSTQSRFKKFGELEMFLHGLDLGSLVDIFQQNQITFQDFLKIEEDDLVKIGVSQLGARKRILEAIRGVHTNEWDLSGLTVDKKSKISTIEAGAIAANIAKHLDFIRSSVAFLRNYIETYEGAIQKDEPSTQKILVAQCNAAYSNSCLMQSDLHDLQSFVIAKLPNASKNQCDFVDGSKYDVNKKRKRRLFLPFIGFLTVLSITFYRYYYR